jgi:hypothetical protein
VNTNVKIHFFKFQDVLESEIIQDVLNETFSGVDLSPILDLDIDDLIEQLTDEDDILSALVWFGRAVDCYNTNRFIGAENERAMEALAWNLSQNESFFAGLVFLHDNLTTELPHHIQYKIRMGKDSVPITFETKSRYDIVKKT